MQHTFKDLDDNSYDVRVTLGTLAAITSKVGVDFFNADEELVEFFADRQRGYRAAELCIGKSLETHGMTSDDLEGLADGRVVGDAADAFSDAVEAFFDGFGDPGRKAIIGKAREMADSVRKTMAECVGKVNAAELVQDTLSGGN